ncbi:MAG: tetratricopeptide repeat protein [Solirubrobacteraceae bacterium]
MRYPTTDPSRPRRIAGLLVLAALAASGATPALADAAPHPIRALSDGAPLLSGTAAAERLAAARPEVCAGKADRRPTPSLKAARADARKLVRRGKGAAADKRFRKSRPARSFDGSMRAAAAALTADQPVAALAALLRAAELRPRDRRPLEGVATVLTQLGKPRQALAYVQAAGRRKAPKRGSMGHPPKALLDNARGYALLGLRRWKDAGKALTAAVRRAPRLTEARANLAHAELCQGNRAAAAKTAVAASRRTPPAAKDVVRNDPERTGTPLVEQLNPASWLDLGRGVYPTLPTWPVPRNEAEGAALFHALNERHKAMNRQSIALSGQVPALNQAAAASLARQSPATRARVEGLRLAMGRTDLVPELRELHARHDATGNEVRRIHTLYGSGQAGSTCGMFGPWRAAYLAYEEATRALVREQYRWQTAVAANVKDPAVHAAMMRDVRGTAVIYLSGALQHAAALAYNGFVCDDADTAPAGAGDDDGDMPDGPACPTGLKSAAFRVALPGVELSVSCEAVGFELEAGSAWLTGFVNVSRNVRKGETTVFVCPRAKTPSGPFGPSAQIEDGIYVTVGPDGVRDAGIRVSQTLVGQAGPASVAISGDSMDFSFVGISPIGAILGR